MMSSLRVPQLCRAMEAPDMNSTKTASERPHPEETSRNLVSIRPFFIAKDLQASIAYYIERFGLQLDFQGPDGDVYYGQVSRDGLGIIVKTILPDVLPSPNQPRRGEPGSQ